MDTIHYVDEGAQGDLHFPCDDSWREVAWKNPRVSEGVFRTEDDLLYTFDRAVVTCDVCKEYISSRPKPALLYALLSEHEYPKDNPADWVYTSPVSHSIVGINIGGVIFTGSNKPTGYVILHIGSFDSCKQRLSEINDVE